jgi:hypothetical protein
MEKSALFSFSFQFFIVFFWFNILWIWTYLCEIWEVVLELICGQIEWNIHAGKKIAAKASRWIIVFFFLIDDKRRIRDVNFDSFSVIVCGDIS